MKVSCITPDCSGTITVDEIGNGSCSLCGAQTHAPQPVAVAVTAPAMRGPMPVRTVSAKRFPQGTTFGKYSIDRYIGGGAMGDVYLVFDKDLNRRAALKVPKFTVEDNSELLKRFEREARNAARVRHPNICAVFDSGHEGDYPYLVTEFIDGEPLANVVQKSGPMDLREAAGIVLKLANAMSEAHHAGIIHRDLKTANVMMNRRNEPIITDFGLARADSDEGLTASGTTLGTTHYMSPEQLLADQNLMGPRADIYSVGVIFFELITGRRPYEGTPFVVTKEVLSQNPPPLPSQFRADVPKALDAICVKAIAKNLMNRYSSMKELATDIEHFLNADPSLSQTSGEKTTSAQPVGFVSPNSAPPVAWGNRILIGSLIAALIGLCAYIQLSH